MGYDNVSKEKAEHGLHISHVDAPYHAWHGNEGDTRERSTHHANRYDVPRGFAVAQEESLVAVVTSRYPSDQQ